MKFEMFDIVNYDRWGNLVKKWVRQPDTRPASIKDFKAQVDAAGVQATYPREYTSLEFIDTKSDSPILKIKLPPADLLQQAEDDLKTQRYPFPQFYEDDLINPGLQKNDEPHRLEFHSKRVGEYTIKFCG